MPVKRPAGLGALNPVVAPEPAQKSVNITDTLTLEVKDDQGHLIRVKESGRQSGAIGPQAGAQQAQAAKSSNRVESIVGSIRFEDLRVLDMLGAGSGGKVRKAQHRITGELYALKSIAFSESEEATRDMLRAELKRLAAFQHPNIVSSYEAYFREGKLYIVLELMDCGTLTHVMKKCPTGIPEIVCAYIAKEFLLGMKHLHSSGVIHRDLKPANLLINSQGAVKISDFGVAKEFGKQGNAETLAPVGSTPYMSPERVKGEPYTFSCDIWSCGLTIAEAAIGEYPFTNMKGNTFLLCQAIAGGTAKVAWDILRQRGTKPSDAMVDFVEQCMKPVSARPSAEELLSHPFVKQLEGIDIEAGVFGQWFCNPSKTMDDAKKAFAQKKAEAAKGYSPRCTDH